MASENAYQKENRVALILPVAVAFVIPGIVGLFQPELIDAFFMFILFLVLSVLPGYVIFRTLYAWVMGDSFFRTLLTCLKPLPAGLPMGSDLKNKATPYITITLIAINTILFIVVSNDIKPLLAFPPHRHPSWWQYPIGFFMHAFMHANWSHLIGNMLFLWIFGNTLETRIGHYRFLVVYIACIAGAAIFCCLMAAIAGTHRSGIGASGAISGIMGVFAVRCYFARVTIGLPFLFLPMMTVPLRVQALVLISLFFAMDTAGSRDIFNGSASNVGYWAHVGGYLFGFFLSFFLGFHLQAAKESVSVKADRLRQNEFGKKEAADLYMDILEKEPGNIEALTFFLDYYKQNPQKHPYIYSMLIKELTSKDMNQAVALFDNFYLRYISFITSAAALKLGMYYYNKCELEKSRNCLEVARNKPGPWQAKATLFLGKVFHDMGNKDRARQFFAETRIRFPGTDFAREAAKDEQS
ncbi:MAG: rhomboid family intramembrane serine protease [Thermodesulfobacteriota bacterium]